MPLIDAPPQIKVGNKIKVGNISILVAVVGPIVQTSEEKNYLPHIHTCYHNGNERIETWTYKAGPVKRVELVTHTQTGRKTLWIGWR